MDINLIMTEFGCNIFFAVSAMCFAYFIYRGRVDPILMSMIATQIYFFPAYLGEISFAYGGAGGVYKSPIDSGVYIIMSIVFISIAISAIFHDRFNFHKTRVAQVNLNFLPWILLGIAVIGLIFSVASVGKGYLCIEKSQVLAKLDGWYSIASYAAPLAFACGLANKNWAVVFLSVLILFADLFVGFRAGASMALLSFCMLYGSWLRQGIIRKIQYIFIVIAVGGGMFVYKQLAWNVRYIVSISCESPVVTESVRVNESKNNNVNVLNVDRSNENLQNSVVLRSEQFSWLVKLIGNTNTYVDSFKNSEPMVTQAILNEVVKTDFKTSMEYLVSQILGLLPGGKTLFGVNINRVITFNDIYQKHLFPLSTFGMASNPWAQAYSAGGYPMVFVFSGMYSTFLVFLSYLFFKTDGSIRGGIVVVSAWWGFYFHRNDVFTGGGIIKTVLYIFLLAILISICFNYVINLLKKRKIPGSAEETVEA